MKNNTLLFSMLCICLFSFSVCPAAEQGLALSGKIENGVRVIQIQASQYKFDPDPVVVKLGEKVRIIATSTDVHHGFAISGFKVNLSLKPGQSQTAEFTADKEGEFKEYCTVYCGSGHGDMVGRFIVQK